MLFIDLTWILRDYFHTHYIYNVLTANIVYD